jgi:hypothetical protein
MVAHKLKHGEMVVTIDVQWLSPVRPGAIIRPWQQWNAANFYFERGG